MAAPRSNLLCFGFVREYCKENMIDFLPNDILDLFVVWFSLNDRFDENLSHKKMKIDIKRDDNYGEYQQIQSNVFDHFVTAICQNAIEKGDKQSWTFQIESRSTTFGIIDDNVAMRRRGNIQDFSMIGGGYGLYIRNMGKYYGRMYPTYPAKDTFKYGKQFEMKRGDMITMELDLTKEKGILRFTIYAQLKNKTVDEQFNNIYSDEIDVDKKWRAAVAIKFLSVKLLP